MPVLALAQTLTPADNLIVEGVPAVPLALTEAVRPYGESRSASFTDWHPTRREMLIRTRLGDTWQLHRLTQPGGARQQVTFRKDNVGGGAYDPQEGGHLFFVQDRGGDEFFQFYRQDLNTGATSLLTDGKSRNSGARYSNRGDRVVYGSTRRNGQDVDFYVMDPREPKTDKLLAENTGGGWGVLDWRPDDARVLVGQYLSINESYLWELNTATGERRRLTEPLPSGEKVSYSEAAYDETGERLYVVTDRENEFQRLGILDLKTGQMTYLATDLKWDVEGFALSKDRRMLAYTVNEDGTSRLMLQDLVTRRALPEVKLPSKGVVGGLAWRPDGKELAFTYTDEQSPSDVYTAAIPSGELTRWTYSETGGLNPKAFVPGELIRWKSFDGLSISGYMYKPRGFTGKRPVIINIHGGPEGQSRPGYNGRLNYFINELGCAIVFPNVRGSSGYGKTFLQMDNGTKRDHTFKDIAALFDWIATQPDLDASRIMVTGGSYGGLMTLALTTFYSDKMKCALSVVGISNMVSFLENTQAYRRDLRRAEYGDERVPEVRAYMEKWAPVLHADQIRKPLFVVQGANDPRVPLSEAEQIVTTLKKTQTPVWKLVAKDEGHGFQKKNNQDFQFYATILFIQEYLLK